VTLPGALDGNAIGGLLIEVFGTEMTAAAGTCASCRSTGPVAETSVYLRAPGAIVRCRSCCAVLMVIATVRDRNCVDLRGLAALDVP
jgi:hypothetical protein